MKISPSIFCIVILPLAVLSMASAVVFVTHKGGTSDDTVPAFWLYMFLAGSPCAASLSGILFHARRHDRTPLAKIDRVAISLAAISALVFGSILLSMYLRTRKLQRELPNHALRTPAGAFSLPRTPTLSTLTVPASLS
jgi:hypothetical protein